MNKKLIYTFGLIGLFLMWGVRGVMVTAPRLQPVMQATPEADQQVVPGSTTDAAIPITGEAPPVAGIFLVYAIFALGALSLILVLLNAANKHTVLYARHKEPPRES